MEKTWILLITLFIFLLLVFGFYKLTRTYAEKEYGPKIWKHWPSKLYYWQAAVFYSLGGTALIVLLLKVGEVF